ncbi:sulfotransferase 4A1 isoform X1 [Bemisia tabaci]
MTLSGLVGSVIMTDEVGNGPAEIREVDRTLHEKMSRFFRGERSGFVEVGPDKYFLPKKYEEDAMKLHSFRPRPDDTWIVTFPRSGTTLTQELIWLISTGLDFEGARATPLYERFPFIEFSTTVCDDMKKQLLTEAGDDTARSTALAEACVPAFEILERAESPRFIKTHLPFSLLPQDLLQSGAKVIYIARNPKDVAVSYFHLHKFFRTLDFKGDFNQFWDFFENDHVLWAPYWSHIKEGWQSRSNPNVCFLFYEDITKDLRGAIKVISHFLGKDISPEGTEKLLSHLNIKNFRSNSSVNFDPLRELGFLQGDSRLFIREGKTDGSRDYYSSELSKRVEKWVEENIKQISGFQFPKMLNQSG